MLILTQPDSEEEKELYAKDLSALVNKARETEVPVCSVPESQLLPLILYVIRSTACGKACSKQIKSLQT